MSEGNQTNGGNQATTKAPRSANFSVIQPFEVEAGDLKNSGEITIDHLKLRLRGRWSTGNYSHPNAPNPNYRPHMGTLASVPDIPGQCIKVNTRKMLVTIYDPLALEKNKRLLERINQAINSGEVTIRPEGGWKFGVREEAEHKVDDDLMKSLLLEFSRKVFDKLEVACLRVVEGSCPTVEEIERADLPGFELYDPWSSNADRPTYVKDAKAWRNRMQSANV